MIAPKLAAMEHAFAQEHVLHKLSHPFLLPFPVQENPYKREIAHSGNAQVRRWSVSSIYYFFHFLFIIQLFVSNFTTHTFSLLCFYLSYGAGMYKNVGHFSVRKNNVGRIFLNVTNVRCGGALKG